MFGIVLNYSGNVGKSTISEHLLYNNLPDHNLVKVETINADTSPEKGKKFSAHDFDSIFGESFSTLSGSIVDVGSSNIENFFKKLSEDWAGAHEMFDYFIVPCSPQKKQEQDTASMIFDLIYMGVPKEKIKLILNMVNPVISKEDQFQELIKLKVLDALGFADISEVPSIKYFEFFNTIQKLSIPFDTVKNDSRDHLKLIFEARKAGDVTRFKDLSMAKLLKDGYNGYKADLLTAFQQLELKDKFAFGADFEDVSAEAKTAPTEQKKPK